MQSLLLAKVQSEFCIFRALIKGCFVVSGIIMYSKCTSVPGAVVCHLLDLNSREYSEYFWYLA